MNLLLDHLTPAQCSAVTHIDGPLLILAGPGSGKTRVITHRIAYLLEEGVPEQEILALTFTNKAADEMSSRVEQMASGAQVWMSTFHRFCARLLRMYGSYVGLEENFTIYDAADSVKVLKRVMEEMEQDYLHYTPERVANLISKAKNNLVTPDRFQVTSGLPVERVVAEVYPEYQKRLLTSSAVDFDDLLLHVAVMLRENPELRQMLDERYRYVMVDEYQDTNLVQYTIIRALSINSPNIAVTGDPDQSIYAWRGANIQNILNFENDFPDVHTVRLERNYRSTKSILRVADCLIRHNVRRKQKNLFTENEEGPPVRLTTYKNEKEESQSIAAYIAEQIHAGNRKASDFAIFYRINALSRSLEFALRDYGIPYQMVRGLEFFQRREIKDVVAYLYLINNPRDDLALLRVINTPPRGIGKKTLEHLSRHATQHGLTLLEAAREAGLIDGLTKRAATLLAKFVTLQDRLREKATCSVEEIMGHVLSESGYQEMLAQSESEEDQQRLENIEELLTAAKDYDLQHPEDGTLEGFLEMTALVNDTDAWENDTERVTLMTLHAAKGLEFPVVFLVAAEEGLLPHERSKEDPRQLEEERRLMFVGITRAEQELHLSLAGCREFRGRSKITAASSFLFELPRDELEMIRPHGSLYGDFDQPLEFTHADDLSEYIHETEQPTAEQSEQRTPGSKNGVTAHLKTATELSGESKSSPRIAQQPVPVESFHQGMRVSHPEYGLGKILALSGSGQKRTATVAFATAGERKFVLSKSPLKPVGSS